MKKIAQPIKPKKMIRILVLVIVVLSYLAGYYHSVWKIEKQRCEQLQKKINEIIKLESI